MANLVKTYPIMAGVKCKYGEKKEFIGVYDFAVDGGAIGSYVLGKLPKNTVITNVIIDRVTAFTTSSGSGTIALTANSAGDLLAAVDADTVTALHAGIPVGTAGTAVKLTADRDITFTIASSAVTAGKAVIHIEYFEGGE